MKRLLLSLFLISFVGCERSPRVNSDSEKALYSIGHKLGSRLKSFDLSKEELRVITFAMEEALFSKEKKDLEEYSALLQNFTRERNLSVSERNKKKGLKYSKEMLKQGFQETKSGLLYKIIREGSNSRATIIDSVMVDYKGSSLQGDIFDSSYDDDEKMTLPLNSVIKGWREALQLIGERGKIEIIVPSDLAYGETGSYPDIEPGETLRFTIDLYKVEKFNDKK